MFTKYGYNTLGIVAVIVFVMIVLSLFINNNILKYVLMIAGIILLIFSLNFFRDPDRNSPAAENIIVSPADGKVLIIKEVLPDNFIEEESWQVSIFMSPLDVHVNRIPIDGVVKYVNYVKGEYLVAYHDKADKRNERNEIGIESEYGKVFFTQVAGKVARRIVSSLEEGDTVKMGERFGMIKFGSRVDVIVPKKWKLKIKENERVKAGETILYELPKE